MRHKRASRFDTLRLHHLLKFTNGKKANSAFIVGHNFRLVIGTKEES